MLAAVVGIGICGVAASIGVFRGILSSTPTIRLSDVDRKRVVQGKRVALGGRRIS